MFEKIFFKYHAFIYSRFITLAKVPHLRPKQKTTNELIKIIKNIYILLIDMRWRYDPPIHDPKNTMLV